jgi:hypothetical protein
MACCPKCPVIRQTGWFVEHIADGRVIEFKASECGTSPIIRANPHNAGPPVSDARTTRMACGGPR